MRGKLERAGTSLLGILYWMTEASSGSIRYWVGDGGDMRNWVGGWVGRRRDSLADRGSSRVDRVRWGWHSHGMRQLACGWIGTNNS